MLLFTILATAAKQHVGDFQVLELSQTAWAFANVEEAGRLNSRLFKLLARLAEQQADEFSTGARSMMFWALSRHADLTDAWGVFEHMSSTGQGVGLQCIGTLLMDCEQRGLMGYEIDLAKSFEKVQASILDGGCLTNEVIATSKEDTQVVDGVEGKKRGKSAKQAVTDTLQGKKRRKAVRHAAAAISEEK